MENIKSKRLQEREEVEINGRRVVEKKVRRLMKMDFGKYSLWDLRGGIGKFLRDVWLVSVTI